MRRLIDEKPRCKARTGAMVAAGAASSKIAIEVQDMNVLDPAFMSACTVPTTITAHQQWYASLPPKVSNNVLTDAIPHDLRR